MDKQELIKKVMDEVKDENLRNELLKQIVNNKNENDSLILNELSKIGINPSGAKDYVGFQMKAGIIVGYVVSSLFLFGGGLVALALFATGEFFGGAFASIFAIIGLFSFISTRKMSRAVK